MPDEPDREQYGCNFAFSGDIYLVVDLPAGV
jgi:hypothetical protein